MSWNLFDVIPYTMEVLLFGSGLMIIPIFIFVSYKYGRKYGFFTKNKTRLEGSMPIAVIVVMLSMYTLVLYRFICDDWFLLYIKGMRSFFGS